MTLAVTFVMSRSTVCIEEIILSLEIVSNFFSVVATIFSQSSQRSNISAAEEQAEQLLKSCLSSLLS